MRTTNKGQALLAHVIHLPLPPWQDLMTVVTVSLREYLSEMEIFQHELTDGH